MVASPAVPPDRDVVAIAARAYERDRYLAALLGPVGVRADLIALAAFAGEIARIPGFVTEPALGEIRLQWWRDALDRLAAGEPATGNPIADAVGTAVRRHRLPVELLHGLIDAHSARLGDAPFADLAALSANLAATDGAQFRLAAQVLGAGDAPPELLHRGGQAYGLARLLLELPATLSEQRCLLPVDRLAAHSLAPETLHLPEARASLHEIEMELAATAAAADEQVRAGWRTVGPALRAALLPVALVRPYLRTCQGGGGVAFESRDIVPLTRVWRLWRAYRLLWP